MHVKLEYYYVAVHYTFPRARLLMLLAGYLKRKTTDIFKCYTDQVYRSTTLVLTHKAQT